MTEINSEIQKESESPRSMLGWVLRNTIFVGFHFTILLAFWSGVSLKAVLFALAMYFIRMFGITAGYHRYFAHRSFKTSRLVQFILALLGTLAVQKGVLWWAGHHRDHHKYSDQPEDIHSPRQRGFWYAHMGWIMSTDYVSTPFTRIKDFSRYPELRFLNKHWLAPFILVCLLVYATLGFQALVWGCFISTIALFHCTFFINSLAHVLGHRTYKTEDDSRNNLFLALLTMGEGWHNNHHYFPWSARQGFHWWQIDVSWWILWCMEKVGLIWDVRHPSERNVAGYLREEGGESLLITT